MAKVFNCFLLIYPSLYAFLQCKKFSFLAFFQLFEQNRCPIIESWVPVSSHAYPLPIFSIFNLPIFKNSIFVSVISSSPLFEGFCFFAILITSLGNNKDQILRNCLKGFLVFLHRKYFIFFVEINHAISFRIIYIIAKYFCNTILFNIFHSVLKFFRKVISKNIPRITLSCSMKSSAIKA